jgi:hypothetical protein
MEGIIYIAKPINPIFPSGVYEIKNFGYGSLFISRT